MEKVKILIADDTEIIAKQTKMYLEKREDVEIVGIANNGKEEIDLINTLQPDLVFTDNQMPQMNGIDVIESIYNLQMEKKPKFILVTGDRDWILQNKAEECDVVKILHKPVDEDKIIEAFEYYKELSEEKTVEKNTEDIEQNDIKKQTKITLIDKIKKFLNS